MQLITTDQVIRHAFFYELFQERMTFLMYPEDILMSVEEFIEENRSKLRAMAVMMNDKYGLQLRTADKGILEGAVYQFLTGIGMLLPALGAGYDHASRSAKLAAYKENDVFYARKKAAPLK